MARRRDPPGTALECRSCKALIFWAESESGKAMPLDVEPNPKGEFFAYKRGAVVAAFHIKSKHELAEQARQAPRPRNRFTCHFATCPNAAQHRRSRR